MMWNWLITALASKASITLFDGSPIYKNTDLLLKIADDEKVTLLGLSAKYIDSFEKFKPKLNYGYKFLNI